MLGRGTLKKAATCFAFNNNTHFIPVARNIDNWLRAPKEAPRRWAGAQYIVRILERSHHNDGCGKMCSFFMEFRFKRGDSVILNGPGRRTNIKGVIVARFSYADTGKTAYYVKTADYFPLRVDECYLDAARFRTPCHSMPTAPANALARAMVALTGAANAFRHAEQSENPEAADIAAAKVLALAHEPMYNFAKHHQHSLINISTLETVQRAIRQYGTQEIDAKLYALPVCLKCGFEDELAIIVPCGCIAHLACILDNDTCLCGKPIERTVVSQPLNTYLATARAILTDEHTKILADADALI